MRSSGLGPEPHEQQSDLGGVSRWGWPHVALGRGGDPGQQLPVLCPQPWAEAALASWVTSLADSSVTGRDSQPGAWLPVPGALAAEVSQETAGELALAGPGSRAQTLEAPQREGWWPRPPRPVTGNWERKSSCGPDGQAGNKRGSSLVGASKQEPSFPCGGGRRAAWQRQSK